MHYYNLIRNRKFWMYHMYHHQNGNHSFVHHRSDGLKQCQRLKEKSPQDIVNASNHGSFGYPQMQLEAEPLQRGLTVLQCSFVIHVATFNHIPCTSFLHVCECSIISLIWRRSGGDVTTADGVRSQLWAFCLRLSVGWQACRALMSRLLLLMTQLSLLFDGS